jgi:hypothetical protein
LKFCHSGCNSSEYDNVPTTNVAVRRMKHFIFGRLVESQFP